MSAFQIPTLLTWISILVPITGKVASVVAGLPYAISMISGILLVGFFMNECGPMFFAFSMAAYVLITNVLFVLTWYFSKLSKKPKAIDVVDTDKNGHI